MDVPFRTRSHLLRTLNAIAYHASYRHARSLVSHRARVITHAFISSRIVPLRSYQHRIISRFRAPRVLHAGGDRALAGGAS